MDYKEYVINNIISATIGLIPNDKQSELRTILDVNLYDYDIFPKEESKELPATIDDFNMELLKRYLITRSIEGLSENTINLYQLRLKEFLFNINKKLDTVRTDDIRYHLAIIKTKNKVTNTTMENIRNILSAFFNWLYKNEYIAKNPMNNIQPIKKDTKKETPYSNMEIELIRGACKNDRDRALIEFLLSTGCRVSEVTNIKLSDVDFFEKKVKVLGKGNKERFVLFNDTTLLYLKKYMGSRKDDCIYLFITNRKPYDKISPSGVETVLKKIEKETGVPNIHPHRFRRTFCCRSVDKGMQIQNVSTLLGHADISTTINTYYNANAKYAESEYARYNN